MKLSTLLQGRDNNFNLIRVCAAFAVLVSHSFALVIGTGDAEPLLASLGVTPGAIAVDLFFITSGFLVTFSIMNRASLIEFLAARFLRIFPALIIMLLLTVFVLGPMLTSWPIAEYFGNGQTFYYFAKCVTLVTGVTYNLPGVFESNPYKDAVNGSLWTLTYEIWMYMLLTAIWLVLGSKVSRMKQFVIVITIASGIEFILLHYLIGVDSKFVQLFYLFFCGSSAYLCREAIFLYRRIFWVLFAIVLASVLFGKEAFYLAYFLSIPYLLLYLAFVPSKLFLAYNSLGDYSYGIYIYAFPIQQTIASYFPGISISAMFYVSTVVTLMFAILSWHLVEKRALRLKSAFRRVRQYNVS